MDRPFNRGREEIRGYPMNDSHQLCSSSSIKDMRGNLGIPTHLSTKGGLLILKRRIWEDFHLKTKPEPQNSENLSIQKPDRPCT
uniref:Uncharacterized protein n=1 Tax=Megaselia scalaris TaxID=36166 RepID=T1GKW7_MEGSC